MKVGVWAAAAALLWSACAHAAVLYSDLGPGGTYSQVTGRTVATSSSTLGADVDAMMQFTAGASGDVDTIDIALSHITGAGDTALTLWTNEAGSVGIELGTWHILPASQYTTSNSALVTVSGISGINLTAGSTYWLGVVAEGDSRNFWNDNSIGVTGLVSVNSADFTGTLGAFDVRSADVGVPEPASWAMMLIGFGGLGLAARRRRRRLQRA
jgi:hypothetical protein